MILYKNDIKKPFKFRYNVDCIGEDVIVDLYTLGVFTPVYEGIEVTTITGEQKGNQGNVNINLTGVEVGTYSIIARTAETGSVGKDILVVLDVDAYSETELIPTPIVTEGWNLSTAVINQTFSTATQDNNPYQMFFKPDGLKMYVVGTGNDNVYEYDLSTAWNISTAVYLQSFDVSSQETFPFGLFFKPDGLKMYVVGTINNTVNEYDLSVAWNVTSAVYLQNKVVTGFDTWTVYFKDDGLKMYIFNNQSNRIDEYDLSTAWDVTSATLLQFYSVTEDGTPNSFWFKPDGTKIYVVGDNSNIIMEFDLSTAWDITTMTLNQQISTGTETSPHMLFFKPDGNKMYLSGFVSVRGITEYDLTD